MSTPEQHPADEFCFFCVPDEVALAGIASYDRREPHQGPTVHWQVPESFCPRVVEEEADAESGR